MLLGHMGGPFWARKDERAWSAPKGAVEAEERPLDAALREFREETGIAPPPGPYEDLGEERQRSGKLVRLFAVEADPDLTAFTPGTFTMTRGGRSFEVPELDRLAWVPLPRAAELLVAGQVPFLARLPR
ncbi:NUDIX domain-containing protein [Amnibacterium endophyticum]|uniref:NUDIX domain-containing protein n=1 Tax=Amnibacterium endophyticum TaxID=2109337 RepID=A0ABW4LHJ0_9MICO